MKKRHIFFDLDNTLWDHRKNAYLTIKELFETEEIERQYQINFQDFHTKYDLINERLWEQIRDGEIDKHYLRKHRFYDTFLNFNLDNFELSQHFETNFLDEILKYNHLVEGTMDVLDYLKSKQYTLHIISNGFQEVTERKALLSGISSYFETITSADSIGIRKPNPKIYQYALDLTNATKSESIMIGDDWIADYVGARDFGLDVIYYNDLNDTIESEDVVAIEKLIEIKNYL